MRAGTTPERIALLAELGILEPENGTYPRRDVLRARFVLGLDAIGVDANAVADGLASGDLTLGYVEFGGRRPPRSDQTFEELSEEIGIPYPMLERLYVAFGLPRPATRRVRPRGGSAPPQDHPGALRRRGGRGRDPAAGAGVGRQCSTGRAVPEPLPPSFDRGAVPSTRPPRQRSVRGGAQRGQRSCGPLRRRPLGLAVQAPFRSVRDRAPLRSRRAALEDAGVHRREPRHVEACAFADLSGYTKLTEDAGDEVAAQVSVKLAELVNEVASHHAGAVVKMLGDGVLFHFKVPQDAVLASLEILDRVRPAGLPPAHVGVNAGPMIYEEGDYFGRTVNIAARIASQAGPDQVFVGEDVLPHISPAGFRVVEAGPFELKGVEKPVTLYEAVREQS